ncbi:14542_t:CDS:2, partial [Racocetra persica]
LTPKQKRDKLNFFFYNFYKKIQLNIMQQEQVKNKAEKYKVRPSDIQEFSGVLAKQAEGTIRFFVTNTTYSLNAYNKTSNSKQQIILCHKDNVIKKIKATKLKLENEELQKNLFELNDLIIENLEIDSDESTIYLFAKNLINILNDSKEYALKQEYSSEAIQINIENEYNNTLKVVEKAIGVGKSIFEEKFISYLKGKGYKVYCPVKASLLLDDELKLFCKDSKNNALFFQYAILNFYKKQAVEINMIDSYNFVIFYRTHIDTEVFTLMNTENKEVIDFLEKKRQEIKIENINKVLYLKPTDKNIIKRQRKRDQEAEIYTDEYLIKLSDFYKKLINKIYPSHNKIENNSTEDKEILEVVNKFLKSKHENQKDAIVSPLIDILLKEIVRIEKYKFYKILSKDNIYRTIILTKLNELKQIAIRFKNYNQFSGLDRKRFIFNVKIEEIFFDIKLTQQKEKFQSVDVEKNQKEFEEYWQQYDTYSDDNT